LLSEQLRSFAGPHADRRVAIVGHSMGGLVARAVIEDPELDPGNVVQLIMIGTPNHGSQLALLPGGLEMCDHLANRRDDGVEGLVRVSIADGLNEAKHDLEPGSEFLKRLNARERNPRVKYSLLIGTGGPLSAAALAELRERLAVARQQNEVVRLIAPRLQESLSDLEELERGRGDGAVAVCRARLEGVEDTELLPFEHLSIQCGPDETRGSELTAAILKRLESPD
jgi:pimeloyl-ACP methyl ester carboxylesterase